MNDSAYDRKVIEQLKPATQYPNYSNHDGEVPVREMLTAETTEPGIDPMLDPMDIWLQRTT